MVKDHSDSKIGNPLPLHGLLFSINSKGSFICTIPPLIVTFNKKYVVHKEKVDGYVDCSSLKVK